jgi:nucleoid-associated protein YgaU
MKTITLAGGTLYRLALTEYGDPTAWWRIAQANGLSDPVLTGTVTLVIPPATATDTGGLLDPRT